MRQVSELERINDGLHGRDVESLAIAPHRDTVVFVTDEFRYLFLSVSGLF